MVFTYIEWPSYRRYLNENRRTGRPERNDALMPPLIYTGNGEPILAAGEVFCRWRDVDGVLCTERKEYSTPVGLERHFADCHGTRTHGLCTGFNNPRYKEELNRWYFAVVNGEMPRWVPRRTANAPVADSISDVGGGKDYHEIDFAKSLISF
ncbi:hypothetical protein GGI43DRAFT_379126 [Trichoderma evansii]